MCQLRCGIHALILSQWCWMGMLGAPAGRTTSEEGLSRQVARVFFQQRPGRLAVTAAPLLVETGLNEAVGEQSLVDLIEHHAFGLKIRSQTCIEIRKIRSLIERAPVKVLGRQCPQIAR